MRQSTNPKCQLGSFDFIYLKVYLSYGCVCPFKNVINTDLKTQVPIGK